eukprot:CAMPEP_0181193540 /NCGR_PEP_ID=MMETSP1096-20121128/13872_1 /TAXON_ID=156174 ORGANISM="Chrysochromulina ericina, Strain CCMP281" /NCGR_SAMPLE_ID=MMETSP1096 /ASSEMBLY_ACC=CAM_ASM_000453 /LENGTH=267 /DNA_ID=CAMNT_0023283011 /DNA_START=10 /DNA_END=812 /DNA_ORIENTATION=-
MCLSAFALGLVGARGLVLGPALPPIALNFAARAPPRSLHMQSELPITASSSLAEMRALIADRAALLIKTTGKGRTKKVIFNELTALCSSAEGCDASAEAKGANMVTVGVPAAEVAEAVNAAKAAERDAGQEAVAAGMEVVAKAAFALEAADVTAKAAEAEAAEAEAELAEFAADCEAQAQADAAAEAAEAEVAEAEAAEAEAAEAEAELAEFAADCEAQAQANAAAEAAEEAARVASEQAAAAQKVIGLTPRGGLDERPWWDQKTPF